jgi:tetratricopeptide (TPR) repeat protein
MELGMGGLAWFWDEFPPAERFILASIAHLAPEGEAATLREIGQALHEHGVRLQGMELSSAPMVLSEWGIIEPVGRDAYRFRVEFLRRWILAKHSLEEAKRELERVSARAVRDYEIGRGHHHAGSLDQAIHFYLRALAANPNHARAQLAVAQAHYEGGHLETATDGFEKAYRLDPESARDGLTAAHRDLGMAQEAEGRYDQARPHYQRVLDILPDDAGTRHRLRDSWRATAGAHLAAGRWEQAAEAYREALRYVPDDEVIQRAVAELEQRHHESDVLRQRRLQLERAVLESRLREEQLRRRRFEAAAAHSLPTFLAISAGAATIAALGLAMAGGLLTSPWVPLAVGATLAVIYAAFAWTRQHLATATEGEGLPEVLEAGNAPPVSTSDPPKPDPAGSLAAGAPHGRIL